MKSVDSNTRVFFALLRGGLWEKNVNLSQYGVIDYKEVYRLAEEQSVVGLVAAGIEHVLDVKVPQEIALTFVGNALQLEQRNKEMNAFIADIVNDLRTFDIYTLIVKGQGVAQCYERPLWRASGDVDFYLSDSNFNKAKQFFRPLVDKFDPNNETTQHINMHYGAWIVEIHANQHCSLSARINKVMDEIHHDLFYNGNVRSWMNSGAQIFLPSANNDVLIIFTHFLNHFYKGGLGVRQICDWCRLLWTYKDSLNHELLETRIREARLMSEWKAFGAFAVYYLGMPSEAMPFYSEEKKWQRKANKICSFIIEVGNFGHNRDFSYYSKYPRLIRKAFSFARRSGDMFRHTKIFPWETICFFPHMVSHGLSAVIRGE